MRLCRAAIWLLANCPFFGVCSERELLLSGYHQPDLGQPVVLGTGLPLELLCRKISRESRLLIYADPREGYAYWDAMADLRDLKRFLSDSPASTEFSCSEDPRFLAIFSIPSAESDVVLQDAAWSHEIGHHIDTVFHVSEAICESPLFDPQRVSVGGSSHEPVGSAAQHVETHQGYREKNATYESWFGLLKNWVRELVADLFAVHVFGPASVFALSQVAPAPTVTNRVSDTHPPTWLRVGAMLDELDYLGYALVFRAESLDPQAEEVRAAVADRIKELRHILPRAPGQYEPCSSLVPVLENIIHALPTIAERVRQTSRDGWRCHAGDVARDVYALVARLACGLPPCEVDVAGHIVGRETSVAAIVNAGWFYRIWRDLDAAPVDVNQAHQQHVQLRRLGLLVLKAIELSAIKSQLGNSIRQLLRHRFGWADCSRGPTLRRIWRAPGRRRSWSSPLPTRSVRLVRMALIQAGL